MIQEGSYAGLLTRLAGGGALLLYVSTADCAVCAAVRPRVEALVGRLAFPAVEVSTSAVPEAAGQLGLFTAPAVLLFYAGREYHRQARFLDFDALEKRMREIMRMEAEQGLSAAERT